MKIDIVIPTKDRKDKLDDCINSIFHSVLEYDVTLYIYFSLRNEFEYYCDLFEGTGLPIQLELLDSYRVPDFWNGHLQKMDADAMMYLNDDIICYPDMIEVIMKEFPKRFPDYDGVMGINQANLPKDQAVEGAFGIIGSKYTTRFPDKKVFCPDYHRFYGDFELWRFAKFIDKFYFCSTARITHLHPAFSKDPPDNTHKDVRIWIGKDKQTHRMRKAKNLLWGESWELINKE